MVESEVRSRRISRLKTMLGFLQTMFSYDSEIKTIVGSICGFCVIC